MQAVEVARLSTRFRTVDEIARVLFMRGRYVREDAIKQSLGKAIDRLDAWIGPAESIEDLDRVDARAHQYAAAARRTKQGRAVHRRLRGRDPTADLASVYYTLLHLLKTGRPPTAQGL